MNNTLSDALTVFITVIIIGIIGGLILSFPIMLLWNTFLVPAITGINEIGWLQAWGIMLLVNIMFKTSVTPAKSKK